MRPRPAEILFGVRIGRASDEEGVALRYAGSTASPDLNSPLRPMQTTASFRIPSINDETLFLVNDVSSGTDRG